MLRSVSSCTHAGADPPSVCARPGRTRLEVIARVVQLAAAFSITQADRLLHYPFRGLLNVHSRSGLRTRQVAQGDPLHRRAFNGKLHFHCSDCYRLERPVAGWDSHPLKTAVFARRTEQTKLMPSFLIGKRSAHNARRFMSDVAKRLARPAPHASDAHGFAKGGYLPIVQISTDGFAGYPEAVDLAFGPYAKYGVIIKEYKNATMTYTPSEMVGAKRTGIRGIEGRNVRSIGTSHVERLNGTQRGL